MKARLAKVGAIVGALLVIAGVSAGGYVLGAAKTPDEADAISAREDASASAFALANLQSMGDGLARGLQQGAGDGAQRALDKGSAEGSAAGQRAARKESGPRVSQDRRGKRADSGTPDFGSPGPFDGSGEVLVVGDSLEVLTIPYLKQYLPGVSLTTNAVGGYNSFQIFDLFKESYDASQSVIVFDAGTNDNPSYPEILAGNLDKVASTVGDRCLVVPTIHGFVVDGVNNQGKNQVVANFAASHPGTQTPDWAGAVNRHPELMQADDLHPIAEGADLRAQLIAEGVQACLDGGSLLGG